MGQSFCNLLYHMVFSTKERIPLMHPDLRQPLHEYLGGIVRKLGGTPIVVNGTDDHVHLLARLRQDKAVSDVLRDIKSGSSGWIHREKPELAHFDWQDGYGAFTVTASQMERVRGYILGQEQHHRTQDFKTEFIALLNAHGIEYDDRYIWR